MISSENKSPYNRQKATELVDAYKKLKLGYDKNSSFDWWDLNKFHKELNIYDINTKTKKASLRSFDDTASVAFYDGLSYVDFGGDGQKHDPAFRVQEVTGVSFLEAIELILEWEGQLPPDFVATVSSERKKERKKPYTIKYIQKMVRNRGQYKAIYDELAKGLFRSCSSKEQKYAEKIFNIGLIPKNDFQNDDRIFIPEIDNKHVAWGSYRYNRTPGFFPGTKDLMAKGLLRKDAKRIIFGEHLLSKFKKDIILAEGHSDAIVNNSKRMSTISSGSSTKPLGDRINLFIGKHIHIFPDLDFAGAQGAFNKALEIINFNKTASTEDKIEFTIYWWSEWFVSKKLFKKLQNNDIPKSDPIRDLNIPIKKEHACVNLKIIREYLIIIAQKKGLKSFNKKLDPNNWTLLSKEAKPDGYDFIDFHNENQEKPNYKKFISTFQY